MTVAAERQPYIYIVFMQCLLQLQPASYELHKPAAHAQDIIGTVLALTVIVVDGAFINPISAIIHLIN